jgi:hypothetical protein
MRFLMQRPLPDELVSSAWSRSCRAANVPITRLTQAVLQRKHAPGFFQSGHLSQLADIFDQPLAKLVQDHTILPYAVAFYRAKPHAQAVGLFGRSGVDARALGAVTQTVSDSVLWRRFCPECAKHDARSHGLSYWHRSHNLPGVLVCTVHNRPLLNTTLPARGRSSWSDLLPEQVRESTPAAPRVTAVLTDIATWSQAILERDYTTRIDASPETYRFRLVESGALSPTADVSSRKLIAWTQAELAAELPWVLPNVSDRRLEWLPLMFRPGITLDAAAIKHVLATKMLELARQLLKGSLDFESSERSGCSRSVIAQDEAAAERLRLLVADRARAGLKLGVQEALEHLGIWAQYRHDRRRYGNLQKAVRQLRRSRVAARRARRRHAST